MLKGSKEHVDYETDLDSDDAQKPFLSDLEKDPLGAEVKSNLAKGRFVECFSLMFFMVIQVFNPILVRIAHRESSKYGITFLASTTVFSTEVLKIIFCCLIIPVSQRSIKKLFVMLYQSFTINKYETLKICMPALIFVIQNNLYFFALQRIDASLFSMTYQLRVLTTALLTMIILGRRFTYLQWVSLVLSLVGAVTVQLGGTTVHEHHHHAYQAPGSSINFGLSDKLAGLTAVLIMCLTNAFGGVWLEAVLKKSKDDIFLQNIRLSLVSLPMSAVAIISDYETIEKHGFFSGWNYYVWLIILTSAFGGIVVSAILRYADNIKKGFCQALALGGTAFISIWLGDSKFSLYLLAGVSLVVVSVIMYAVSPSKVPKKRERVASSSRVFEEISHDKTAQFV